MTYNADSDELLRAFNGMRAYWASAEIDAPKGVSFSDDFRGKTIPTKTRWRADIVISRNLARADASVS
ncbi:hypothetical protein HYPDE_26283 [Hyphomicrobium denitrificans 1NES1]|uniref:Uncharacterized protein n=1 Tax=Hyphomicrobium denitrificans 1NES1 TaxID=670307 RepID=N0B0H4_9HYPH|nr:hypothetical protein [Hyphomicrobium denitrificans]AGK56939.1 hypothetical protein HYPDE_26283 [Hyphomicrobium denitrificans 1NES1]